MPPLTQPELEKFFTTGANIMRLSTLSPSGHPYVVPVWFWYEKGKFMLAARRQNEWLKHIDADGRVGACIDTSDAPYARVLIQGTASIVDRSWTGPWEPLAVRYVGYEAGHAYYEKTKAVPRVLVSIDPDSVISWSGSDWHRKYNEDFGKPGE
jgi:nitroimidazol reductase NimA-like FMN-containing flavoprotein (pyridoxamine 5'-phosphate oxidase superfamily)